MQWTDIPGVHYWEINLLTPWREMEEEDRWTRSSAPSYIVTEPENLPPEFYWGQVEDIHYFGYDAYSNYMARGSARFMYMRDFEPCPDPPWAF